MKFKYKSYGHGIFRPVIPVEIEYNGVIVPYGVLVDSGADFCLFHASLGEVLGLNVQSGQAREVFGIGGKSSIYYLHKINIVLNGKSYEIEAGFMPNVAGHIMQYGVVGQRGFFDKFVVKFDLLKSEIELKSRWNKN